MTEMNTYYARCLEPKARRPLDKDTASDTCIVGGGLAGLTTALELTRAGRSVVVLEAESVGFGASGRNGGFVGPAWSQRLDALVKKVGVDHATELYKLSQEGVEIVARNVASLAMPGIDLAHGKLSAARTPSREAFMRRRDRLRSEFGQSAEVWETEQVRGVLKTSRYFQAMFYEDDFQINPLAYARGLADEIERLGGRVYEGSRVTKVDRAAGKRIVRTGRGNVTADSVVLASGGYTEAWAQPLHGSYIPIATYVMLTRAQPELIAQAIQTSHGVGDQRRAGDYYRLVEGGSRILWGGRITTRVGEPRRLGEMLRATMISTYPQLSELEVEHAWSGLMGYARHLMPQIRQVEEGLWSCSAFGGHGLNTTAIGGKIVAEAIVHDSDRWKLFDPFGFEWNGGPAGKAAVQATYWWLQARDAFGEALSREADTGA
ncbi:MAG: FAD-binding oxidoreductase [Sphingomonadales bacterium]|nr:MAG: FAD-binding oxidoreductase [Sphingomonadales bacterium]